MYSKSTIIISILNVKQVKDYFIVILSVNNKNMEMISITHINLATTKNINYNILKFW